MLYVNEQEDDLVIELYEIDNLIEKKTTTSYKTELRDYDVEVNFIQHGWDYEEYIEYDEFTPTSSARIETDLNKITIDNLEGIFVDIIPKQNCLKSIVGYKGDFYRGFEVLFKKRENTCENLESFNWSSELLLKDFSNMKRLRIDVSKTNSQINYFDNTDKRVEIKSDYIIGKPLEFVLEDYRIKGQVDLDIPCQISFTYFRAEGLFEVKVNNIMFYVENSLEFSVNNKLARFEIKAR